MKHKSLIIDLDGTLTIESNLPYADKHPNLPLIKKLKFYKKQGFKIVIFTSRAMRTFDGDMKQIKANALPEIIAWLDKHKIPYNEVIVGKPWCGMNGFYVDDRAIRPSEFVDLDFTQITQLLAKEKLMQDSKNSAPDSKATTQNFTQDSTLDSNNGKSK